MKKLLLFLVASLFAAAMLCSCGASPTPAPSDEESPSSSPASSAQPSASESSEPSTSAGSAKTGFSVLTTLTKSADAGVTDGKAQVDSTVVAVTVDQDGKIISCVIDAVQAKIQFDDVGRLLTAPETMFETKNELSDAYGLKEASGIGKEWYEQATAFAKYIQGMTVEDVNNIKVDEQNYTTQPDLKASVTISIGSFVKGVEKAVMNAKSGGGAESDRLSLGIITSMKKSSGATSDKEGLAEVQSTVAIVTRDVGGKITSCLLDEVQSSVSFTAQGKITTDLTVDPQSKIELGEAYGLKEASGIGKEWFEQAEAFAEYLSGKTAAEIDGIAVDENGQGIAEDVKASVTISIGAFKDAVKKAMSGV